METCVVCSVQTTKYKCPKCFSRYCSISCCKAHKESCQQGVTSSTSIPEPPKAPQPPLCQVPNYPLWTASQRENFQETGLEVEVDKVPEELLNKLKDDEEIRGVLHNPHLRAMVENLVNSNDPSLDIAKSMQEPIFTEFADKCLRVVDPDNQHIEPEAQPPEFL